MARLLDQKHGQAYDALMVTISDGIQDLEVEKVFDVGDLLLYKFADKEEYYLVISRYFRDNFSNCSYEVLHLNTQRYTMWRGMNLHMFCEYVG